MGRESKTVPQTYLATLRTRSSKPRNITLKGRGEKKKPTKPQGNAVSSRTNEASFSTDLHLVID